MDKLKSISDSPFRKILLIDSKENDFSSQYQHLTPKNHRQIELLYTPHICQKQKDLFAQLLGTETKFVSPLTKSSLPAMIQQEFQIERINNEDDAQYSSIQSQHEEDMRRERTATADENRKRKRKSNAQLKLLKQQFYKRQTATWSKDRIVEMAALTGLSESQVYKWCWDQKKKTSHGNRDTQRQEDCSAAEQIQSMPEDSVVKTKQIKKDVTTRRKMPRNFQEDERRVSKKLLFG